MQKLGHYEKFVYVDKRVKSVQFHKVPVFGIISQLSPLYLLNMKIYLYPTRIKLFSLLTLVPSILGICFSLRLWSRCFTPRSVHGDGFRYLIEGIWRQVGRRSQLLGWRAKETFCVGWKKKKFSSSILAENFISWVDYAFCNSICKVSPASSLIF